MAAVKPPFVSMPGRAFWGLVVQKGPWKSTYSDYQRAHQVPGGAVGGGVPVGGTGEGKRDAVMTPYQQNGRGVLPEPSEHATQSVVRPGESWMIKKPPPGMKRSSKLKAALTIGKSNETNYEDIRHAEGMEPSMPPPPPDLKSTFLTEDRLSKSRNKNALTVVTRNLPRSDIDASNPVSQPPSYSTGGPPSYRSSSGRPMDLDTPGIRTPRSLRSSMSIDTMPGGGRRSSGGTGNLVCGTGSSDFSIPVCGVPAPPSSSSPGSTMSVDTSPAPFTPPVIDQISSNTALDEELADLKKEMQKRKLTVETSGLPPPARRAGMRVIGSSLDPGGMDDVANEFYPTEKRKGMGGSSGREKKGKLTLPPKPKRKAEDQGVSGRTKKGKLTLSPKRKAEGVEESGPQKKKGKSLKPVQIQTRNLPPSRQSSTRAPGIRSENASVARTSDALPAPRTRAAMRRANGSLANVPVNVPRHQRRDSGFSG
jgi:hypothetical protein